MDIDKVSWWDDAIVGDKRVSHGRTITESEVFALSALMGSFVPLHNDVEYAKTTIYGQRVVSGQMNMIIAAGLRVHMLWYGDNFAGPSMIAFLGFDNVRFPAPLFIGDTIHLETTIQSKKETSKPNRGIITFLDEVVKQDGTVVARWERAMMQSMRPGKGE